MIYEIPLEIEDGNFSVRTDLDATVYNINFRFNYRLENWIMSLKDSVGNLICSGPVRPGVDIFLHYRDARLPSGRLYFLSLKKGEVHPSRDELGDSVFLFYDDEVLSV